MADYNSCANLLKAFKNILQGRGGQGEKLCLFPFLVGAVLPFVFNAGCFIYLAGLNSVYGFLECMDVEGYPRPYLANNCLRNAEIRVQYGNLRGGVIGMYGEKAEVGPYLWKVAPFLGFSSVFYLLPMLLWRFLENGRILKIRELVKQVEGVSDNDRAVRRKKLIDACRCFMHTLRLSRQLKIFYVLCEVIQAAIALFALNYYVETFANALGRLGYTPFPVEDNEVWEHIFPLDVMCELEHYGHSQQRSYRNTLCILVHAEQIRFIMLLERLVLNVSIFLLTWHVVIQLLTTLVASVVNMPWTKKKKQQHNQKPG